MTGIKQFGAHDELLTLLKIILSFPIRIEAVKLSYGLKFKNLLSKKDI